MFQVQGAAGAKTAHLEQPNMQGTISIDLSVGQGERVLRRRQRLDH